MIAFFVINLGFITYTVDLEQLVSADPSHFVYPLWPPAPFIDLVHAYAHRFDPLVLARPVRWKVTIWFDALGFGFFTQLVYMHIFVAENGFGCRVLCMGQLCSRLW